MSRVSSKFKQRDVTRALKAIRAARVVARVEIDTTTGNIIIIPDATHNDRTQNSTPLDEWMASHGSN
jgi:hypothetical protein